MDLKESGQEMIGGSFFHRSEEDEREKIEH